MKIEVTDKALAGETDWWDASGHFLYGPVAQLGEHRPCLIDYNLQSNMLDTKIRGNVTELECMTAFVKEGYNVYIPFGEDSRFDFIGDVNGNLLRVQCKSCHEIFDDGEVVAIEFKTVRQSGSNTTHYTRTQYSKDEIDYFATSYKGECYLVPVE